MADWDKLLGQTRYNARLGSEPPTTHRSDNVTVFEEDAERVIYSSPFRRLQGKTQVHPLPTLDYLRTRLTHTIEVAHVGKILGAQVATRLKTSGESADVSAISDIVYAACLAHDLGNPPFGHIGEYAIQTWFQRKAANEPLVESLLNDASKGGDFKFFDGNAQGFRILTRLAGWRSRGGLQLSYATLGAFSKYPFCSTHANPAKAKFGYMHDDRKAAEQIFSALGMTNSGPGRHLRHPLAYLVEAADDICYLTTDIDDAHRMKLIPFVGAEKLLKDIAEAGSRIPRYAELSTAESQDKIAYLRFGAVNAMIDAVVDYFLNNLDAVKDGAAKNLLESTEYREPAKRIQETNRKTIYTENGKMQLEAAGYNIIMNIMDIYGDMFIDLYKKNGDAELLDMRNYGIFKLLPQEFSSRLTSVDLYQYMLVLIDYVAGMTDRYILDLFQKLTGSSVNIGRMN